MSRTFKDTPRKHLDKEYGWDYGRQQHKYTKAIYAINQDTGTRCKQYEVDCYFYTYAPGVLTKKPKRTDTEYHWMTTPSWFNNMKHTIPQRRQGRMWEHRVLTDDLEETDPPQFSKKPHIYYW